MIGERLKPHGDDIERMGVEIAALVTKLSEPKGALANTPQSEDLCGTLTSNTPEVHEAAIKYVVESLPPMDIELGEGLVIIAPKSILMAIEGHLNEQGFFEASHYVIDCSAYRQEAIGRLAARQAGNQFPRQET